MISITTSRFATGITAMMTITLAAASENTAIVPYTYLNSEAIQTITLELPRKYPNFVEVDSSQNLYGLPSAGTDQDCLFDNSANGCANWIITIYDRIKHNVSESAQTFHELPEVLLSGALHGDERVGPTTVIEVARLLLEAAQCESYVLDNVDEHKSCQLELQRKGVDDRTRRWLARLVATRRIIIIPSANALGYYRNQREEDGIDPNRDFPFDLQDFSRCMQTVAARTLNEVFRDHLIQLSFTFHAGMEAIGYEWGAPSHEEPSPDDKAQNILASRFSWYGGKVDQRTYPFGDMNSLVYPVNGGMEDWAYAASWDKSHTRPCDPKTYNGYTQDRTIYEDGTLRTFNMLVETSDSKEPPIEELGSNEDLFSPDGAGNGHVSRNIRLSLLAFDAVQPYVTLTGVNGSDILDIDAVPHLQRTLEKCSHAVQVSNSDAVEVEWTVGGAFDVDETNLVYGARKDMEDSNIMYCTTQPDPQQLDTWIDRIINIKSGKGNNKGSTIQFTVSQKGRTRWHERGSSPLSQLPIRDGAFPSDPVFRTSIDLSSFQEGDEIVIFAMATVDSSWNSSNSAPQSHIVNARTNTTWRFTNVAGMTIQGRVRWLSPPITLTVGGYLEEVADPSKSITQYTQNETSTYSDSGASHLVSIIHLLLIGVIGSAVFLVLRRRTLLSKQRSRGNSGTSRRNGTGYASGKHNIMVELETLPLGMNSHE
eukprot:CAMPEP_0172432904 /NCGR_PEP_ID=MMETSP1064-20121228/65515_1 /TAXON_ID=202472 /ORGANISM="Aulacoseira subarctica , Strain CCAP 1002/5" /LENGTH=707 /DNA_ID=CAMNT_0013180519 /DNA_START=21 /DNA_END=2144 /DNA_ORIENTATION=+